MKSTANLGDWGVYRPTKRDWDFSLCNVNLTRGVNEVNKVNETYDEV